MIFNEKKKNCIKSTFSKVSKPFSKKFMMNKKSYGTFIQIICLKSFIHIVFPGHYRTPGIYMLKKKRKKFTLKLGKL